MSALPDPIPLPDERRKQHRLSAECRVHLTLETDELHGRTQNVSRTDALVFTDQELRVTIEMMEDGVVKRAPGKLVRLERLPDGGAGWAVEFDD